MKGLIGIVVICLSLLIGLLAYTIGEENKEKVAEKEISEYVKMECSYLGNATSPSHPRLFTPVFFCKHIKRNACFYIVRTGVGVTMTGAPCYGQLDTEVR